MREPVWKDIEFFKQEVKKYKQFNKGYKHYSKYLILYKTVLKLKPKYVLECGSGLTTVVIASALRRNGQGKLISIDELPEFGEVAARLAGEPVEMHISPSVEDVYEGVSGTRYKAVPEYPYDIIFVDGPQTTTIDLDAFYLLEKYPQAKVLIDCRVATVRALQKKYGGRFDAFVNLGFINF